MKKRQSLFFLLTLLVLIITFGITFQPERVEILQKYPYSLVKIEDKETSIENNFQQYQNLERQIPGEQANLEAAKQEAENFRRAKAESMIDISDLITEMHMPSVLILLEQYAIDLDLDLTIHFGSITEQSSTTPSDSFDTEYDENQAEEADPETDQEPAQEQEPEPEPQPEIEPEPMYDTVRSTDVPISIVGSYNNIREYVTILEEKDFIEPREMKLTAESTEVEAEIIIKIFSR